MDPYRRQILEDMGIEVWRRRSAKAARDRPAGHPAKGSSSAATGRRTAALEGHGPGAASRAAAPERQGPGASRRPSGPAPSTDAQRPPAEVTNPQPHRPATGNRRGHETPWPQAAASPHQPATSAEPAFTLIATCAKGALVATGAFASRKQATLAADIARCAGRDWAAAVEQMRFDWPLPGLAGGAGPAVAAFMEKQLQDFAVQRALVTNSAAKNLPVETLDCLTIPDLEQLEDPEAKRELWRQLQDLNA